MDYKKAWNWSNALTALGVFGLMLGGGFAHRSQTLFWAVVIGALALVAVGYVIHFKWCRCPHCGDRIRVTDWLMRLPKICPKCHEELK
ncbi:cysteine-rich KTR domain-containing protein [Pseudoflavonifractor sp. MSJ-37]|uniref:cysteine-rich KTR domain-containing protein n=1 Tax=Pseudoflavonifractor sp. MSJ-37 TaxID=2841531 RepID=UPI001C0FAFB1|nr:cysteine-rich KTR domain-containing protein [Pseudoflavonifractor sp. MSJ-37]MBU5434180.1 cysteine-rich KTR domain-containing protein [Pseudoflavonifractor sp. MSJ-37]